MITPEFPGSKNLMVGIISAEPGKSPHRWHSHVVDRADDFEILYPDGFEEVYFIVKGNGKLTWRKTDGKVRETPVQQGDAIYFGKDIAEHQVLNTGDKEMVLVFVGSPPTRWRPK